MRQPTSCLHCGSVFTRAHSPGRLRSWCYECLPAEHETDAKAYHARANQLAAFRRSGKHGSCCGVRTCKDCDEPYEPWCKWSHPGAAGPRCHPCYLAYTRKRQTPLATKRPPANPFKYTSRQWQRFAHSVYESETHCGICGEYVEQTLPFTHRMSRTVDHIQPISLGGAWYDRDNVRLAHRSCNSRNGQALHGAERAQLLRAALWIGTHLAS